MQILSFEPRLLGRLNELSEPSYQSLHHVNNCAARKLCSVTAEIIQAAQRRCTKTKKDVTVH